VTRLDHLCCHARRTLLTTTALLLVGCSASVRAPSQDRPRDYPWQLAEPAAFEQEFLWRQTITARFGSRKLAFEAALQRRGNTFTLLGFGPGGAKAFLLQQTGSTVTSRALMPVHLPFPPRFVLIDVQRTFLPLQSPPDQDGERSFTRFEGADTERVDEQWRDGRLLWRSFRRESGQPAGEIVIEYGADVDGRRGPITLRNRWFGYTLTIETLEATKLHGAGAVSPAR
jgi:hypothetical protein